MKIFYAVQATGNGHISRARQLLPYLNAYGEVDVFLSGCNATLNSDLPVKYKSPGVSLFFKKCGGLDYWKIATKNKYFKSLKDVKSLPVENYDVIINDFDYITARACKNKNIPSVQFGHQASFESPHTPRPAKKSLLGEWILTKYAPATQYLGLHFKTYDDFIKPPVIKKEFLEAEPKDMGHITVYLPSINRDCLKKVFYSMPDVVFHMFIPEISRVARIKNIVYHPISTELFNDSLINCHGILTGGGFETPAEALYLGKKLIAVPIEDHYEQMCNGEALSRLGATVWDRIDTDTLAQKLYAWIENPYPQIEIEANNIHETLQYLFDTYPTRSRATKSPRNRKTVEL